MKPKTDVVRDISFKDGKPAAANDIVEQYRASGGFTAKKLGVAVDIVERMLKDKDCLKFFSFPACINATGTRGIVKDFIRRKWFDVIMGTCGTLDHDIARIYENYYHGDFMMDDRKLLEEGISRLGNVLVPTESYGIILEDKFKEFLPKIFASFSDEQKKKGISTHELIWKIGELIDKDPKAQKHKEESIVYWLWKNQIPMVVPGPTDGSVGYQIWQYAQDHDFRLNLMADETMLINNAWDAKKTGALIIGGGISKHHTIWHQQWRGGLEYAVYISTAVEWDGSLSGAQPREAISWKKISKTAKFVNVEEDATIALPLIYAALNERFSRL